MVVLELSKDAFTDYKCDKGESLNIDLTKVREILKLAGMQDDVLLKKSKENRLSVQIGKSLTRRMPLLDDVVAPKIPSMELPAKVTISTEKVSVALRASENVADVVEFVANKEGFQIRARSESDEVEAIYAEADLTALKSGDKEVKSMYSLDYITKLLRGIPTASGVIEIEMGDSFPAKINFTFADDKGKATFLVAPRIEND
jgi:proliferating cell nuclear antigen